jgi:hypothetical protein
LASLRQRDLLDLAGEFGSEVVPARGTSRDLAQRPRVRGSEGCRELRIRRPGWTSTAVTVALFIAGATTIAGCLALNEEINS